MTKFRVEKNKNYTVMSNIHLRDKNLSYKAKGLLSFMLSLPDDWDYSINGLECLSKEGKKAVRSAIKELEENKYLVRERNHLENGRFDYDYIIYEIPCNQKGYAEDGHDEKGTQINTNIQNTEYKDKIDKQINTLVKELINRNFIEEEDFEMYRYNDLFNCLLLMYGYEKVIKVTNYTLGRWKQNNGLDENGKTIINKYGYFKTAIHNNLNKISEIIDLGWDD